MTTVNPVEVVCNFLKSEEGKCLIVLLGEKKEHIEIGTIDGGKSRIILTGAGFRKKQGRMEIQATAYDVEEAMLEIKQPMDTLTGFMNSRYELKRYENE